MKEIEIKISKAWSISSLSCGVIGLGLWIAPYFGLPLSIMAIVFRSKDKESSMSTAGMILGIIGIVTNSVMLFLVLFYLLMVGSF